MSGEDDVAVAEGEDVSVDEDDTDPLVELRDVSVVRDGVTALSGVDLTVRPGELHALTGPNGAGKTTLLSVVLGLRRPTAGTVERPETIGCGFQEPNVYGDLSVAENLRVFSPTDADPEWRDRVEVALGLEGVSERRVDRLSGGYRRRLDLALAFARRPRAVVLDEPLDELDGDARERALSFAGDYPGEERGVLVATHDPAAYEGVADRVTVLTDGEVVRDVALDGDGDVGYSFSDASD